LPLDGATAASWIFALATVVLGLFLLSRAWRSVAQQWQRVHAALQARGTLRVGAAVPSEVR
jgi:hypothetical protein